MELWVNNCALQLELGNDENVFEHPPYFQRPKINRAAQCTWVWKKRCFCEPLCWTPTLSLKTKNRQGCIWISKKDILWTSVYITHPTSKGKKPSSSSKANNFSQPHFHKLFITRWLSCKKNLIKSCIQEVSEINYFPAPACRDFGGPWTWCRGCFQFSRNGRGLAAVCV